MLATKLLSKKLRTAPKFNANGTRAITMEDYKKGNFTTVGAIIQRQQISAALMQSRNSLYSGFQGFAGQMGSQFPAVQTVHTGWNQLLLGSMFQQYSAQAQQFQLQMGFQMSFLAAGGGPSLALGFGF